MSKKFYPFVILVERYEVKDTPDQIALKARRPEQSRNQNL